MKVFETVDEYLNEFKIGDIITLGGKGILDGVRSLESKYDTFKVIDGTTKDKIVLRRYRGRRNLLLGANYYDQPMVLLTNKEFSDLKNGTY